VRILFLTHRLPYAPNRGDRIRAYHIMRVLARDHDFEVVSLVHDEEESQRADDVRAIASRLDCAKVPKYRNHARAALALPTATPLTHVLLSSPDLPPILRRAANRKPDVVLAYCTGMAQYALQEPLRRIPFVLDMVDVDSEKWNQLAEDAPLPLKWIYRREHVMMRRFERNAARAASATTVVAERERHLIDGLDSQIRAHVIPNGIDLRSFAPAGEAAPSAEVVFCGVFDYEPNARGAVWLAEQVWPLVRQRRPEARLTLVGMNPSRAVSALGRDPSITVTGSVPDVRPYLWRAALAVAPLQVARGLQNKVLEALAAGLPCVVTTDVFDGLPDAVKAGCTNASTAAGFADAIVELLGKDPGGRRAKADKAQLKQQTKEKQN
jgi:sugar transferase (PEP-CTERM/EpsH1 system associated)